MATAAKLAAASCHTSETPADTLTSCWLTCCDLADLRLHTKMLMSANAPVLANMLLLANVLLHANMSLLAVYIAQSAESKRACVVC